MMTSVFFTLSYVLIITIYTTSAQENISEKKCENQKLFSSFNTYYSCIKLQVVHTPHRFHFFFVVSTFISAPFQWGLYQVLVRWMTLDYAFGVTTSRPWADEDLRHCRKYFALIADTQQLHRTLEKQGKSEKIIRGRTLCKYDRQSTTV